MITLQGCAPVARGRDGDVVGAGGDGAERRLTMGDFISRWQATLRQAFSIPVAFLGVGAYRAWLATFFRFSAYPSMGFGEYAFFEVSIGVVSLLAAASYFTPVLSSALAAILLSATLSWSFWQGAGMVCLGSLLCWYATRR